MVSGASALAAVSNVRSWGVTEKQVRTSLNVMPAVSFRHTDFFAVQNVLSLGLKL